MITLTAITYDQRRIDYTDALIKAELTLNRMDSPGKLSFSGVEPSGIALPEGTAVTLTDSGITVFQGFVFTASRDRYGTVEYTAYDQLRYLKAKQSYTFANMPLEAIIKQIAEDFGLTVGTLAETGYSFPALIKENESCLDIIFSALSDTIYQTGKIFVFYDDAGKLTLTEAKDLQVATIIGDGSMLTDYTYKRDIDSATYNRIKLARPNAETGRTDIYVNEDTESIKKWGLLQYYDKVDNNLNDAQIATMCELYLRYYNRVTQSLSLEAMGIPGIRAGMIMPVVISAVSDLSSNRVLLVEKVTHTYEGSNYHKMKIDVKNFEQLGGGGNALG